MYGSPHRYFNYLHQIVLLFNTRSIQIKLCVYSSGKIRNTIFFVYFKLYYVWKYPKVNLTLVMSINEASPVF
jgi:hypothetical protein